ncbi:MAG: hypothetical protein AB7O56_12845 [Bauldia sp.]
MDPLAELQSPPAVHRLMAGDARAAGETTMEGPARQNQASVWIAIALIAVGAFFFIVEVFNIRLGIAWWPLLFLLPGLAMIAWAFSMRTVNSGLAVSGANLATLGGIFLYQTASGNWESWTYIWTLFPLATGVALMAAGNRNGDETLTRSGLESARWGGIAFVVGVVIFEVFIFGGLIGYIIPLVLVAIGGFILWNNSRDGGRPFGNMQNPFGPRDPDAPPFPSPPPPPPMTPQPPVPPSPAMATPPASPPIVTPPPAAPPPVIAAPPPAAVVPPTADEVSPEPFPADDIPEAPQPDGAPFPADAEAPATPPPASPKGRSRRAT